MLYDHTYDTLVSAIYEGPLEETPWQEFLPLLGQTIDALAVSLMLRPPAAGDGGLIINYQRPKAGQQAHLASPSDWEASAYREHFFSLDPFINLPDGTVTTLVDLMPATTLEQSEYYQQYLKPAGVYHIIGFDTREPNGLVARLRVCRSYNEAPFSDTERELLTLLIPHLKRAVQLYIRISHIQSERDLYANAIDRLAVGAIILDENAQVLNANPIALTLLASKDGLYSHNNHLQLNNRQQAAEFQTLINKVIKSNRDRKPSVPEALRVSRPSGRPDLGLIIRPVPVSEWLEGESTPCVAIFISDPELQIETSQETVIRLFGFTPAEASLALLLTQGLSMAEASAQLTISQHTARAQLKAIFSKTSVSRQAELVRLIIKSVANLG